MKINRNTIILLFFLKPKQTIISKFIFHRIIIFRMKFLYFLFLWGILLLKIGLSIDTFINFTSSITFNSPIKKALTKTLGTNEYIYILYADNSIGKYSNQMVLLSRFSAGSKIINDFNVLDRLGFIAQYSIYGIVQGGLQFVIIRQSNPNTKVYYSRYSTLSYIFLCHVSFLMGSYDVIFFYNDAMIKYNKFLNKQTDSYNFSSTTPSGRNYPLQVIQAQLNGKYYKVVRTSLNQIYVIRLYFETYYGYLVQAIQMLYDFNHINSNPVTSFCVDKNQIVVLQFADSTLFAIHMVTSTIHTFQATLTSAVGASVLKMIKPVNLNDGQRVFIFNDKSIRVNLNSLPQYSFLSYSQTNLLFGSNFSNTVVVSTSSDFIYQKFTASIYSYCQTLTVNALLTSCTNNIQCSTLNCLSCDIARTTCYGCLTGYFLYANFCYLLRACAVSDCYVCHANQTCVVCNNFYSLNSTDNTCVYDGSSLLVPNINIVPNTTNNMTYNASYNSTSNTTDPIDFNSGIMDIYNKLSYDQLLELFSSADQSYKKLFSAAQSINSFPGSRTLLNFLSPLFQFFDDYWYYIYHEDSYPQVQMIPIFLMFMKKLNDQRILASYVQFQNPINVDDYITSNYFWYTNNRISYIDQKETYFISNIQDVIFSQYMILAFMFTIIKIISMFFKFYLKKKNIQFRYSQAQYGGQADKNEGVKSQNNRIAKAICKYLQDLVSLKSILLTCIGANMVFLSFNFACQLRIVFLFNNVDSINIYITIILGAILISFTFIIFLFEQVFSCPKPEKVENIQKQYPQQKNQQQNQQYISQDQLKQQKRTSYYITYFGSLKNLIFGFIHGFFIQHTNVQYILLIMMKLFLLHIIINKKQLVKKLALKVFMFSYFLAGILMDLLLFFSKNQILPNFLLESRTQSQYSMINIVQMIFLVIIVSSVMLQVIIEIIYDIAQLFSHDKASTTGVNQKKQRRRGFLGMLNKIVPQNLFSHDQNQKNISECQTISNGLPQQRFSKDRSQIRSQIQMIDKIHNELKNKLTLKLKVKNPTDSKKTHFKNKIKIHKNVTQLNGKKDLLNFTMSKYQTKLESNIQMYNQSDVGKPNYPIIDAQKHKEGNIEANNLNIEKPNHNLSIQQNFQTQNHNLAQGSKILNKVRKKQHIKLRKRTEKQ